jgi:hypothetical protein
MNASISEDGSFLFSYLEPDTYLFRVIATVEGDYATPFDLITIEEDDVQIETPIQIPTQTVKTELTSGLFHADDGLIVDIDPNTFESYEFSGDEYFSSVSIPVDEFPFSLGTLRVQGELIRIWYLGDFHAQTSTPWPIMIEGLQELEGETLYFFNANLNDYEWTELGSATVDEDGFIQSPIGIQHLSMLVVLKI